MGEVVSPSAQRPASSDVTVTRRADGSLLVASARTLPRIEGSLAGRLAHWAALTPDAIFLSDETGSVTFGVAERTCRRLSAYLLTLPVSAERPVMILAQNGIVHALVMLAATAVGVPAAIVSPAYAAPGAKPWTKIYRVIEQVDPGVVFVDDPHEASAIFAQIGAPAKVIGLAEAAHIANATPVAEDHLSEAACGVTLDSVAKLLFTSGSTGVPKAVINTQRMLVSNMLALSQVWPFLAERPPRLVDWLPWNHTFGGNCCFDIALWFGGSMHIDSGRPAPAAIGRTVAAIRAHRPSIYFNVPVGYELLLPILESDQAFAAEFLGNLDFLFNAGAALPSATRRRLEAASMAATGRVVAIAGGWGSTETAPFSTALSFPTKHASNLGVPIPGTTIKMVPDAGRYELRIKGPNVTPGYWRDPSSTAMAFDEEGFYRIGDAGKFADEEHPGAGILFDGRTAENFKLTTGTFVNVAAVRLSVISEGGTLISDAVVAGENRDALGLVVFVNEQACRAMLSDAGIDPPDRATMVRHPVLEAKLAALIARHNAAAGGSSMRVARFLVAAEPLCAAEDEVTDKGYINQRRVLTRRASLVDELYETGVTL